MLLSKCKTFFTVGALMIFLLVLQIEFGFGMRHMYCENKGASLEQYKEIVDQEIPQTQKKKKYQ